MKKQDAIRGIGWNILFAVVNRILIPIVNLVLASLIGPAGVGLFAVINSTYVVIELFREFGIGVTYLAEKHEGREKSYNFLSVANGLIFGLLLFLSSGALAQVYSMPEAQTAFMILSASVVFGSLATIPSLKLQKREKFMDLGLIETSASLISIGSAFAAYKAGMGFMSLVLQMVVKSCVYTTIVNIRCRSEWGKADFSHIKDIAKVAVSNVSANLAYTVYTMCDYMLIKHLFGATLNGCYAAAYNIANKPVELVAGPIRQTVLIAFLKSRDDPERLARVYSKAISLTLLVIMPMYLTLFFHAHAVMSILYSPDFAPSIPLVKILCLYLGTRAIGVMAGGALAMMGKTHWNAIGWIPAYIIVIAAVLLNQKNLTLEYVVWALTIGAVSCYTVYALVAFKLLKLSRTDWHRIGKCLGLATFIGLLLGSTTLIQLPEKLNLLIAVGAVVPIALVTFGYAFLNRPFSLFKKSGLKEFVEVL